MNRITKELATKAGFKIFGDKIVAADNGSSGLATQCLDKFTDLIIAECVRICNERADSADGSYTPSKALVARKTAKGCAILIEQSLKE